MLVVISLYNNFSVIDIQINCKHILFIGFIATRNMLINHQDVNEHRIIWQKVLDYSILDRILHSKELDSFELKSNSKRPFDVFRTLIYRYFLLLMYFYNL